MQMHMKTRKKEERGIPQKLYMCIHRKTVIVSKLYTRTKLDENKYFLW